MLNLIKNRILYPSVSLLRKITGNYVLRLLAPELKFYRDHIEHFYRQIPLKYQVETGRNVTLMAPYYLSDCTIGDFSYLAPNSVVSLARIGKFCSIGPNFLCGWGIHPVNGISTHPMFYSTRKQNGMTFSATDKITERIPVEIGNDVFIGMNVTLLDGVKIGHGAVIGAGAVVTSDIPDYAVAGGVPARVLSYRFDQATIEQLLAEKWWDLPTENLSDVEKYFFDVNQFLNRPGSRPKKAE